MRVRRPTPFLLLAAACAALLPTSALAQVRIAPQVGVWAPLSDLPSAGDAVEVGEREATLAWGLSLELGNPDGTSFRLTGLHGTGSEVPVSTFGCTDCETRTSSTALTAAVVLRPIDLVVLQPHLLLGAGIRRLDFDRDDLEEEGFDAVFSDQNDAAGHVGVGIELELPILHLMVELSDVISSLEGPDGEGELQHDMFLMVGIVF